MKKTLIFILTLALLLNTFLISAGAETAGTETGITPRWTNCIVCDTTFGVFNNTAEIAIDYYADEDLFTYAKFKVTIEKRTFFFFWSDVNEWTTTAYEYCDSYYVSIPADGSGEYRATFYLEFYGNTGAVDVVEDVITYDYEG